MNLLLQRYSDNKKSTLGLMFKKNVNGLYHVGHTLEDEHRDVKVKGETRISAGTYEIKIRKVESPATLRYRKRYPWFKFHLELQNVPNFQYIYIHPGVNEDWTDGCILLSDGPQTISGLHSLSGAVDTFKRFYDETYAYLEEGNKVTIQIRDEDYLIT